MAKTIKLITGTVDKSRFNRVEDYKANRGFNALHKVVNMDPEDVIQEIIDAKLLGRGGAGFPTGRKWQSLYRIKKEPKYVVCNADEGEPGTFKDRLFLKEDPLIVIEGMLIAAYVFKAKDGYIYMRGEYRDLREGFQQALENCKKAGYMGKNIMGIEGFDFDIHLISGAGAYVCGETSSLLNSIEGKSGRPRQKPPRLSEVGLYGMPTLVNNVESYASIPIILDRGAEFFRSVGTEDDGGSAIVCLSGHAKNKGVYEIPLGTNLKDIIYDEELGGGTATGRKVQFVHMGGQSGPLVFPEQLDVGYDYKSLKAIGMSRGTGALVVADESVNLIEYLKKVMEFFNHESCGKCTPCREGNMQLYYILDRISKGEGEREDLDKIRRLSRVMTKTSFCGLGQASTQAVMTALTHREKEFVDLIESGGSTEGTIALGGLH